MIFRPTCSVRLQLYLESGESVAPKPEGSTGWLNGVSGSTASVAGALAANAAKRASVGALRKALSPPDFKRAKADLDLEREQLQGVNSTASQTYPAGVDPNLGGEQTVIFAALPAVVTITRQPSKDADTAQIMFAFRDLPIDPRCVRAALASVAIGATPREEYAQGMSGARREDGTPLSIVQHDNGQELRTYSSTRYVGFAATWETDLDESSGTVTLNCIDISAPMRTQRMLGRKIDLQKPIDQGIQELVDAFPASRGIKVVVGTPLDLSDSEGIEVQKPAGSLIPAHNMPPVQKTKKGKVVHSKQQDPDQTVWDHLQEVALRSALVPVMRGFTLYLMEPRVYYRSLSRARKMVWGENVQSLRLLRRLEGSTLDTIEVRCPDRSIGRVLWARYPVLQGEPKSGILGKPGSPQPVVSRASKVTPNGTGHEKVRVLTVRGIASLALLEQIAEATFHEIGRQEIQGTLTTYDIDSFESKHDADLLDLYSGMPVDVLVKQAPRDRASGSGANTLQDLQAQSVAERQKYLETLGISQSAARKLARAQELTYKMTAFRAGTVTIHWSIDDGVSIECDFYNFVVLREDPEHLGTVLGKRSSKLSEAMKAVK